MSGEKIPLVFFPRFTTLSTREAASPSAREFRTPPVDMLGFQQFHATFWRGQFVPGTGSLDFKFEQSADLEDWTTFTGTVNPVSPAQGAVVTATFTPKQRYVRCIASLGGDTAVVLWAIGLGVRTEA